MAAVRFAIAGWSRSTAAGGDGRSATDSVRLSARAAEDVSSTR